MKAGGKYEPKVHVAHFVFGVIKETGLPTCGSGQKYYF